MEQAVIEYPTTCPHCGYHGENCAKASKDWRDRMIEQRFKGHA